ncbi:MAG: flagella assembly protein FlgT middle domain-containing protein [Pseudomonadota bacterium]
MAALASFPVTAAPFMVEASGSASFLFSAGGKAEARQEAFQKAMAAARREAAKKIGGLTPYQEMVMDPAGAQVSIQAAEVIGETINGNTLTVRIRAAVELDTEVCNSPTARYRKKLTAVAMPLLNPRQVVVGDVQGYDRGIPSELLRKLATTGRFLTRDESVQRLYPDPRDAPNLTVLGVNNQAALISLGERTQAQYVLSGVVQDIGYSEAVLRQPGYDSLDSSYPLKVLGQFVNLGTRPRSRRIEVEFFVHDAHTGRLITRHRYAKEASGEVVFNESIPFGSRRFYESDFGKAFEQIFDLETTALTRDLQCLPFVMRVLQINGKALSLDAGTDTGIHVGDRLTAYRNEEAARPFGVDGTTFAFGKTPTPLQVTKVFSNYAVAESETPLTLGFGELLQVW